jgi:hypothetical protein
MMDKENQEKPILPPSGGDSTKRMWDTTALPTQPRKPEDDADIPEVVCEFCRSTVKIRRGGRCPVCHM